MQINLLLEKLLNLRNQQIETVLQDIISGNFVDRTNNYLLDTGTNHSIVTIQNC